jgi:hypothetical protein
MDPQRLFFFGLQFSSLPGVFHTIFDFFRTCHRFECSSAATHHSVALVLSSSHRNELVISLSNIWV